MRIFDSVYGALTIDRQERVSQREDIQGKARKPEISALIGLPGAGKSTWRAEHLKTVERPLVVISTDDLIDDLAAKSGLTYTDVFSQLTDEGHKELTAQAYLATREAIARRDDVIIDRTNMTVRGRARFLSLAPRHYVRRAIVLVTPFDVLFDRLETRYRETGKRIPAGVVYNMMNTYVAPSLDEFDVIDYVRTA